MRSWLEFVKPDSGEWFPRWAEWQSRGWPADPGSPESWQELWAGGKSQGHYGAQAREGYNRKSPYKASLARAFRLLPDAIVLRADLSPMPTCSIKKTIASNAVTIRYHKPFRLKLPRLLLIGLGSIPGRTDSLVTASFLPYNPDKTPDCPKPLS